MPDEDDEVSLPPNSPEAERGLLACCLIYPVTSIGLCLERLAGFDAFYDLRHRSLYELLVSMYDSGKPIEIVTVYIELKRLNLVETVGGLDYVAALPDATPSAANIDYFLTTVREKHTLRKLISTSLQVASDARDYQGELDPLLESADANLRSVIDSTQLKQDIQTARDILTQVVTEIEEAVATDGALPGIPTGFMDFDRMTGGLGRGEYVVIAARPSIGKSSWALNIAVNVARAGYPVLFNSLEMTASSLMKRAVCSEARVSLNNVRFGNLVQGDLSKLATATALLSKLHLFIDDTSGLSVLQVKARARRAVQVYAIRLLIIDYLQLMHSSRRRWPNQQEEVSDISKTVKSMAKELDIPVMVLSQLNREPEKSSSGKPRLADLRGSGSIEQDADVVALLYNHEHKEGDPDTRVGLIVAKSRNGPTGETTLAFAKHFTRFESTSRFDL